MSKQVKEPIARTQITTPADREIRIELSSDVLFDFDRDSIRMDALPA